MPTLPQTIPLLASGGNDAWITLPQWALVAAGVVGVVIWLFGHATVKFGFGVLGLLAGGLAGYLVPGVIGASAHPWIPAAIGAAVGLLAGIISFRFSVALIQGAVLAVVAALLVFVTVSPNDALDLKDQVARHGGGAPPARGLELEVRAASEKQDTSSELPPGEATGETLEQVRESLRGVGADPAVEYALRSAEDLRETTRVLADRVRPVWNDLPREHRTAIALAAVGAGTIGLGLGLFFPKRSSSVVTALAGAMLWVPALMEMMARGGWRPLGIDPSETWTRIGAVSIAAVIGTCIQWAMTRRGADKA